MIESAVYHVENKLFGRSVTSSLSRNILQVHFMPQKHNTKKIKLFSNFFCW